MSEFSCPMTTLQYIMHPNYALQHRNHEINYEFIAKNQYINTQSNTCMSFSQKKPKPMSWTSTIQTYKPKPHWHQQINPNNSQIQQRINKELELQTTSPYQIKINKKMHNSDFQKQANGLLKLSAQQISICIQQYEHFNST